MKDYYKWHDQQAQTSGGGQPRLRDYLMLKLIENIFIVLLFLLLCVFGGLGLLSGLQPEQRAWALNAANLCLGVFLGLFAGRKA